MHRKRQVMQGMKEKNKEKQRKKAGREKRESEHTNDFFMEVLKPVFYLTRGMLQR